MPSAITTSWMPPQAERWLRVIKPVSVWRTPAVIQVWGEDTPALLTHRFKGKKCHFLIFFSQLSCFISQFRTFVIFGAGIEPRLLRHLPCQHRLSVDWHYRCFSWRLYSKGESLHCYTKSYRHPLKLCEPLTGDREPRLPSARVWFLQ